MTVQEMIQFFRKNHVPDDLYLLGNLGPGEKYGIEESIAGWLIYYSERGEKERLHLMQDEDAACRKFIDYIAKVWHRKSGKALPTPPA
jgi:hypothetical protein